MLPFSLSQVKGEKHEFSSRYPKMAEELYCRLTTMLSN